MARFGRVCPFLCGAAGLAEQMQGWAWPLLPALHISASTLQQRAALWDYSWVTGVTKMRIPTFLPPSSSVLRYTKLPGGDLLPHASTVLSETPGGSQGFHGWAGRCSVLITTRAITPALCQTRP